MSGSRVFFRLVLASAAAFVLASPCTVLSQVAGTEGIKQGERFAKAGGESVQVIVEAQRQLKTTLDAYNALVTKPTKNPKADYRKLLKDLGDAKAKIAVVKPKVDAMNVEAEAYYKLWGTQVENISDADLKTRGNERIASNRKAYDAILASLREASTALAPFLKDLGDQINFMGSDLRPEALASLKGNAEQLNAKGETLFSHTDTTVSSANEFFAPLRSK